MARFTSRGCLSALFILAGLSAAWAQKNIAEASSFIGNLEYTFEIGRHESLVKLKRSKDARIAPFASDGCSGGLSAGWTLIASALPAFSERHGDHPPWERCCLKHDRVYHTGGARSADAQASFEARRTADRQLRQCVIQVGEKRAPELMAEYGLSGVEVAWLYRRIADTMYAAVRSGGAPCTGLSWRWGFGWPHCQ